jgi:TRAP-type C4-dicarboxylate transport system permease small subunit
MTHSPETPVAPAGSLLGRGLAMAGMGILLLNVLLVAYDVLLRWLAGSPQSWVADIGAMTYPLALACCVPAALESGHMIAIRFLGDAIGPRTSEVLDLGGSLLLSLMLALIAWKMTQRAVDDWSAGYRTANIALPMAPTWAAVAALLAVGALVQLRLTWRGLAGLRGGPARA